MPDFGRPSSFTTTFGFWVICSLLAVALAFPTLFMILDHHGVERLPGHTHVAPVSEIAQTHLHTFGTGHLHGAGVNPIDEGASIVVRAAAETPGLVLFALLGLALPAVGMAFGGNARLRWPRPRRGIAVHQVLVRPPTPPPTLLLRNA